MASPLRQAVRALAARPAFTAVVTATLAVAIGANATIFSVVVFATSLAGRAFDLDVDVSHLASTTVGVGLMGVAFGLLAMAIGARTGNRGEALGVASGVAAASYLASAAGVEAPDFAAVPTGLHVRVLGIDGLDRKMVELMRMDGELPRLEHLVQASAHARLAAEPEQVPAIVWTTMSSASTAEPVRRRA